jgi:hypothetical protein
MASKLGEEILDALRLGAAALIGHHGQTNLVALDSLD